jgi:sterol desaturase/sphingolipid hydroxylase (fatty acid hydroxylase superfamily)
MLLALSDWLCSQALHAPYWGIATATTLWFVLIYVLIAGGAYWIALYRIPPSITNRAGRLQRLRPGQVREELRLSALSILIFALQTAGVVWLIRHDWLVVDWQRSPWHLWWEMPSLYLWNELHFFVIHHLLHGKALYLSVHIWHHRSVLTTPFSAYSFHPAESFLLGSVMPLALALHAFSPWALLGLTVMSLMLNVSGHLPHEEIHPRSKLFKHMLRHSRYHNRHHREFHTHYAFSLAWLDRWFTPAQQP